MDSLVNYDLLKVVLLLYSTEYVQQKLKGLIGIQSYKDIQDVSFKKN